MSKSISAKTIKSYYLRDHQKLTQNIRQDKYYSVKCTLMQSGCNARPRSQYKKAHKSYKISKD